MLIRKALFTIAIHSILHLKTLTSPDLVSLFSFESFRNTSQIDLMGDATLSNYSVRLTNSSYWSAGRIAYRHPIPFWNSNIPFSTRFSFSFSSQQGNGLIFSVLPGNLSASDFNRTNFKLLSVELGVSGYLKTDLYSFILTNFTSPARSSYEFRSGEKLECWIDYNVDEGRLQVTLKKYSSNSNYVILSCPFALSEMFKDGKEKRIWVSLSSSSKNSTQVCTVYSWSFRTMVVPHWLHSEPYIPGNENTDVVIHRQWNTYVTMFMMVVIFGVFGGLISILWRVWAKIYEKPSSSVVPQDIAMGKCGEFDYEKIKTVLEKGKGGD